MWYILTSIMKLRFTFLFLFLFNCVVFAQDRDIKKLTHQKQHKVAHGLINKKSYYNAVDHLNDLVKLHPTNKKYVHRLADAYFYSRDYKNAEIWYEKTIKLDGKTTTIASFRYSETLKYNAKYQEARDNFLIFSKSRYKEVKGERYKYIATNEIKSCEYALENKNKVNPLDVIHLGDHVNSKYTEFSPRLMNDSTLVFASLQSDTVIMVGPDEPHTFHVKLMTSSLYEDIWGESTELPIVNSVYESNANGTFSIDGKRFYFTRCLPDKNNHMVCKVYVSDYIEGVFSKPTKLSKLINAKKSTNTMPQISSVLIGKKEIETLFFVSNRKGTRGGLDIYYAFADGKNGFKKPVNMGRLINTIRDDISPYYEPSSGTMYFSSNYHYGFGGYDVFKCTSDRFGRWSEPENLGKPINTRVDDTYYNINKNTNEGFFVSNRPEGYHLTSETCCDDIYTYKLKPPFVINVNVFVKETKVVPDSVQLIVLSRPLEKMFNYSPPVLSPQDTGLVADSIFRLYKNSIQDYLKNGLKKFDALAVNKLIEKGFYPELVDAVNIFDAELNREYIVYAFDNSDTAVFTFTTKSEERTYFNSYSYDTSDVRASINNAKKIDLISIDLFLDKKVVIDTTPVVAIVEDEKLFTVAKLIEDSKQPIKKILKVILNYDFDDANFIRDHAGSLDSMANFLKQFPEMKIMLTAHTDNKGSDRYNHELSKRRARSIEDYFQKAGIEKQRIKSKGMGEAEPKVPNENIDGSDNEEGRRINRRAEIVIEE